MIAPNSQMNDGQGNLSIHSQSDYSDTDTKNLRGMFKFLLKDCGLINRILCYGIKIFLDLI